MKYLVNCPVFIHPLSGQKYSKGSEVLVSPILASQYLKNGNLKTPDTTPILQPLELE